MEEIWLMSTVIFAVLGVIVILIANIFENVMYRQEIKELHKKNAELRAAMNEICAETPGQKD